VLSAWPVSPPRRWVASVNRAESVAELEALRRSLARGQPFGTESWTQRTIARLGLESTVRPRGRPRKARDAD
jgi:putative transposase